MMARRLEVEIVADTREFHRGLAAARRALSRAGFVYPGSGPSTPEFERMLARIKGIFRGGRSS